MTDWQAKYDRDPSKVYPFNGMRARLGEGEKGPGDLVLLVWVADRWGGGGTWEPLSMHFMAFAIDFLYANEDEIHPPARGYAGGEYFADFVWTAVRHGYKAAIAKLDPEKRRAQMRRQKGRRR